MTNKISYEDVTEIIEKLIILKQHEWKLFTIEYQDVAQEIRIFCTTAVKKFDASRGTIEAFLNVCITNFLKHLARDKYFYAVVPCVTNQCGHNDKVFRECHSTSGVCNKMIKYLKNKKLYENFNLYGIVRLNGVNELNYYDDSYMKDIELTNEDYIEQKLDAEELIKEIERHISKKQLKIYSLWRTGCSIMEISKEMGYASCAHGRAVRYHLKKIKSVVDKILKKYYGK